jgi:hypothetical protein
MKPRLRTHRPRSRRPSTSASLRRACPPALAALALSLLAACAHTPPGGDAALTVLRVDAARFDDPQGREPALREACAAWRLSERQVAAFFAAGREYPDGTHDAFYWLPCSIKGRLRAQGREWDFEINAAATATWTDGADQRRWGCTAKACEPLVLLMPDEHAQ